MPALSAERITITLQLKVGGRPLQAEVQVPAGDVTIVDILPLLQSFASALIDLQAQSMEQQGKSISCRAGCGACCRQLVPISEADAFSLAEQIAQMPPERQTIIQQRFQDVLGALEQCGLLARLRTAFAGPHDQAELYQLGVEYLQQRLPCPFLEEESCSIHQDRPIICREYLVTSPPQYCEWPTQEHVEGVPIPIKFSETLARFNDGLGQGPAHKLPLVLLFDWLQQHPPQFASRPGPELFRAFIQQIASKPVP